MALTETETAFLTSAITAIDATILKILAGGVVSSGIGGRSWSALNLTELESMRTKYNNRLNGTGSIHTNHVIIR